MTSKKKAKDTEKDSLEIASELEFKLDGMKADKEKKCKAAKDQLVEMLDVTKDKYFTATGVAEALRVLRFASDGPASISDAVVLARKMAQEVTDMIMKAKELSYDEMDNLCDDFYSKDFGFRYEAPSPEDLAYEMMRIDLCRNVGGAAEDMVSFVKRVDDEIAATELELSKVKAD